ncbi:hypothetical protein [Apibacter mensalis]|nr:hypothetical protein [Apibacter mensalis]
MKVSTSGMGCMKLSFGTGEATDIDEPIKIVRTPFDKGITFFDTAIV